MNKKYLLIVLAVVFLLWWTNKAKATPKEVPTPEPVNDTPFVFASSNNYTVKKGDTLYKIVSNFWPEEAGEKTKDKVLLFAKQNAIANGFNWGKYDDVPSNDLRDPDTLKTGQKLVIWTWGSFNENNPERGQIMPGQQANAFNSWDILL
jgi:hypothetical protein